MQTKHCHCMISALLICAQHEICLVFFDLQFHCIYITETDLVSTGCCRGQAEPIRKFQDQHVLETELTFGHYSCLIMGLAYVDSNTSNALGILSGSYPILNKNNIIWSIIVISADGSCLQVFLNAI